MLWSALQALHYWTKGGQVRTAFMTGDKHENSSIQPSGLTQRKQSKRQTVDLLDNTIASCISIRPIA